MAGAAGTLSGMYSASQRMKLELREGLEQLEKMETYANYGRAGGGPLMHDQGMASSSDLTESLRLKLAELQKTSVEMDRMCRMQGLKSQKDIWKRKVEHISEEADALRTALDKYLQREGRRQREAHERAELIGRTTGENARVLSEMEADERDMNTLARSARVVEEALHTGYGTLKRMAEQREVLKGAQRKALDVLNYVGLSDTVLKKINRRHIMDRWISYGGMLITLIVVAGVWKLTH
eukprot:jgi/Mesen1/4949/ME000247S04226